MAFRRFINSFRTRLFAGRAGPVLDGSGVPSPRFSPAGPPLPLIERYILARILTAMVAAILTLAILVWTTQALRQLDLVTAKGQALTTFFEITLLALPFLILVILPFALLGAALIVLAQMNGDSELIVINASGGGRRIVLRPLILAGLLTSLAVGALACWIAPAGLQIVRERLTEVRVDLIAVVVKPGRFITVDEGLTFHISDRDAAGRLIGLMLNDDRDQETTFTYLAERGEIVEAVDRTLLVMQNGTIQRRNLQSGAISLVDYDSYVFDLTSLLPEAAAPVFKPSERLVSRLLQAPQEDSYYHQNRSKFVVEFHDRWSQILYPLGFVLWVFVCVGEPSSTRRGRASSLVLAAVLCAGQRLAGYGVAALAIDLPLLLPLLYAVPLSAILLAAALIAGNKGPDTLLKPLEWVEWRIRTQIRAATRRRELTS